MQLTIHRGSHEIGGNCVELIAMGTRIVIDIGMPLFRADGGQFNIRDYDGRNGPELVEQGVLARVEGLYKWDTPSVDAVLLSHAHQDHHGFLKYVHPEVPVHMSEGTRKLIEISALFMHHQAGPPENTVIFDWPSRFAIGAFTVTPHLVDHSAASAFAFELEAEGKRVFYSGDFREHGHIGARAMGGLYRGVSPGVDALLMEGTTLGRDTEGIQTEAGISEKATALCRETKKAVFVFQSGQNVSRAVSFFKAAQGSHRLFIPDIYMAHVLYEMGHCPGGDNLPYPGKPGYDNVRVWFPSRQTTQVRTMGRSDMVYRLRRHRISLQDTASKLGDVMFFVRPGMEIHLRKLNRLASLAGSTLIYSLWGGYREVPGIRNFLEEVERLGIQVVPLHTSGHADRTALERMVEQLEPKRLIPIHSFAPGQYEAFSPNVEILLDGQPVEF